MFIYLVISLASLFNIYSAEIDCEEHEEIDYTEIGIIHIPRIPRSPRRQFDPETQLIRIKPCQRKNIDGIPISPRKTASIDLFNLKEIDNKKNIFDIFKHPVHYAIFSENFDLLKLLISKDGQINSEKLNKAAEKRSDDGCTPLFLLLFFANYSIDLYHQRLNDSTEPEQNIKGFKRFKKLLNLYSYYINNFLNHSNLTEYLLLSNSNFQKELKRINSL